MMASNVADLIVTTLEQAGVKKSMASSETV